MVTKKILILPLTLACCLGAPAETRIYREKTGPKTIILNVVKEAAASGWIITATAGEGAPAETQVYTLDESEATIAWTFVRPGEKTDIRAVRDGEKIILTGLHEGEVLRKEFDAGSLPWNQAFQFGLESFAAAGGKQVKFWSIGTSGPVAMSIAKLTAEIKATETIRIGGRAETARHVRLTPSGLKALLWHGDYWYRESDGVFLRYIGRSGPAAPLSVMDLQIPRPGPQPPSEGPQWKT